MLATNAAIPPLPQLSIGPMEDDLIPVDFLLGTPTPNGNRPDPCDLFLQFMDNPRSSGCEDLVDDLLSAACKAEAPAAKRPRLAEPAAAAASAAAPSVPDRPARLVRTPRERVTEG